MPVTDIDIIMVVFFYHFGGFNRLPPADGVILIICGPGVRQLARRICNAFQDIHDRVAALLSRLLKNSVRERRTILIEVGMQNAAQAIAVASSPLVFNNQEMAIPAILYSLMMNVVLLTYVALCKKKPIKQ